MKKTLKNSKGITLIALVVTIIVLIILAAVSINLTLGKNGIIERAQKASDLEKNAEIEEKDKLESLENDMHEYTKARWKYNYDEQTITNGTEKLKLGDYINYNHLEGATQTYCKSEATVNGYADQEFNLSSYTKGWRVLGVENGNLLLAYEYVVGPDSGGDEFEGLTYSNFGLQGKAGIENGEKELDRIAGMFGQGKHAIKARNMKVEDLEKLLGIQEEKKPHYKINIYWQGTTTPYYEYEDQDKKGSFGYYHRVFWLLNDDGLICSENSPTATTENKEKIGSIIRNNYTYTANKEKLGEQLYDLIFESQNENDSQFVYWLSSETTSISSNFVRYNMRAVVDGQITYGTIFGSHEFISKSSAPLRPVVYIDSDVKLNKTGDNTWEIVEE